MAEARKRSLLDRIIGVARLDAQTFEEIEHDETATIPAMIIAALAGFSLFFSQLLMDPIGWTIGEFAFFAISFVILAIIGWVIFTAITHIVGHRLFRAATTEGNWQELLRTLGFAGIPLVVAGWLTFVPFVNFAVFVWFAAAVVVAVRQATDVSTGRAIAIALPGTLILVVMQFALLLMIFRPE